MSSKRSSRSSTKAEADENEATNPHISTEISSQKVAFIPVSLTACEEVRSVELRHPCTGEASCFLLGSSGGRLERVVEVTAFDEGHRSWFVGDTVQSDGKLYLCNIYNPIYLILPYLIKAPRLTPLEQTLEDPQFPHTHLLAEAVGGGELKAVAEPKGAAELNVWKYSEAKALEWLEGRCRRLKAALMEAKVPTCTAQALTFVRSMDEAQTQTAYSELAVGMMATLLPAELGKALRERLGLPLEPERPALKGSGEPPAKRARKEGAPQGPTEDYSTEQPAKKEAAPQSAKAKALAKSAVGNKSILSFFGKKPAK